MPHLLDDAFPAAWLSRVEDAGLNASAPPQQRWLDGWLMRLSPGKAKRARCINALAPGRLPLDERLRLARAAFAEAGLPLLLRMTPFSQPAGLDDALAALGFRSLDNTRVMVQPDLAGVINPSIPAPPGCELRALAPTQFAEVVGLLRGSPLGQRTAHAQRLLQSPVPCQGYALIREGQVVACGQFASEAELVGLYDVCTAVSERSKGWGRALCQQVLAQALQAGARSAYLQVEHDNAPARAIYQRMGFRDAYGYRYRTDDPGAQ